MQSSFLRALTVTVDVSSTNSTDLVIDINGYFAPQGAGGLSLYAVTPCRVLDTRLPSAMLPLNKALDVNVKAENVEWAVPSF